jgi:3-oxoacyl-[acyl-carrier-protein] synthase-3
MLLGADLGGPLYRSLLSPGGLAAFQREPCAALRENPRSILRSRSGNRAKPLARSPVRNVLTTLRMKRTWKNVRLLSWATDLPDEVLTSDTIERRLAEPLARAGLEPGVLAAKTGVHERRVSPPGDDPELVAGRVAKEALLRSGLSAHQVGAIYCASIDHRYFEPSAAHFVARALGGAPEAQLLDVRNACLGFLDAISIAAERLESGAIEVAIVVAAEAGGMRRSIEHSLAATLQRGVFTPEDWVPLTMGCGAVAWVLGAARRFAGAASIDSFLTQNRSEHALACTGRIGDDGRLQISANGPAILRFGVPLVKHTLETALHDFQREPGQVFLHQVGSAFTTAVGRALGLVIDDRALVFPRLGNMGPVGAPFSVARAAEDGWLRPGHPISILGGASGLSAAFLGMTWLGAGS